MILIIVESPTKARTFNRILKEENKYFVFATKGHFRDLPVNRLAIDYEKKFLPEYEIVKSKEKIVAQLKELASKSSEIILATDPDREGEAIAYHCAYVLDKVKEDWPKIKILDNSLKRIVFHEITANALKEALENPTNLRLNLVYSQQSRRILDRIVGYELSPLLWKKTGKNWLSAGRVQTVALRLIVEREKEINNFTVEDYFQIYGFFDGLKAKLISKDNVDYEQKFTLKLFAGEYTYTKTTITKDNLQNIKNDLQTDQYKIKNIEETVISRYPPPPYTTSLLQQDAFYKLGFSSKMTMNLAQNLYENGLITYHRTDSFSLSTSFVFKAKDYIIKKFGEKYALEKPRSYKTHSKLAQEAHEAIRPTKLEPNPKLEKLSTSHKKLYQLIFNRALATQMKEAQVKVIKISIEGNKKYLFLSESEQIVFDGFLALYKQNINENQLKINYKIGDSLKLEKIEEQGLKTKPPPRYNEASLIKTLEEKGIGRPSTYAPIISLIQVKNYVEKNQRYFSPTPLGTAISDYLSANFSQLFSLDFTALMEDELDQVANGEKDFIQVLEEFYQPFKNLLQKNKSNQEKIEINEKIEGVCPLDGGNLIVRYSRFGKFIACANYPKCRYTKKIEKTVKGKKCPICGGEIVIRYTKTKKKFFGCANYPKCNYQEWSYKKLINNE
ncbi:MAG: type I DNA topoisomerase [Microgenomates group bacterium]